MIPILGPHTRRLFCVSNWLCRDFQHPCSSAAIRDRVLRGQGLGELPEVASEYGLRFYGLPQNAETEALVRERWTVPDAFPFGEIEVDVGKGGARVEGAAWLMSSLPY
jgi:dihydroorotase